MPKYANGKAACLKIRCFTVRLCASVNAFAAKMAESRRAVNPLHQKHSRFKSYQTHQLWRSRLIGNATRLKISCLKVRLFPALPLFRKSDVPFQSHAPLSHPIMAGHSGTGSHARLRIRPRAIGSPDRPVYSCRDSTVTQ